MNRILTISGFGVFLILFLISVSRCGSESYVKSVAASSGYNIDSFPEAKDFLMGEVDMCGRGVIDPDRKEENKCDYFIDVSNDLFERFKTGLKHDKDKESDGKQWMMPSAEEMAAVPESWDMRKEFPQVADVSVNRQVCGDCWAQSTSKGLEIMMTAYDHVIKPLSVQYLISRCIPSGDCNGGYMTTPNYIIKNTEGGSGNPYIEQDPYKGVNSSCKFSNAELQKGFEAKLEASPWVGSSLQNSKWYNGTRGNTAAMIKAMMYKYKSPALVTVAAYDISGNAIYSSCSNVNGGTNHMVNIVGWGKESDIEFASVWNSWGKGHGLNGISRIKWECGGPGKLNRALGQEARVFEYKPTCPNQPDAFTGPSQTIIKLSPGVGVQLGKQAKKGQSCHWLPEEGLSDPNSCNPFASPDFTTEYHLTATTECGEASAMVTVNVLGPKFEKSDKVLTPFGIMKSKGE